MDWQLSSIGPPMGALLFGLIRTKPEHAIMWITANPAKSLGVLDQTGTLEPGKMADVVVWNHDPFSVYALTDLVFVDGVVQYDREHPGAPVSDFLLGQPAAAGVVP